MIRPDNVIREIIRVPESEADTFVGPRNIRRLERDVLEGFGVMPGMIPDVLSFPFILCDIFFLQCICVFCLLSHSLNTHSIFYLTTRTLIFILVSVLVDLVRTTNTC